MADQDEYFLNYKSKLIDMLGQTCRHPATGKIIVVVEQTYDPHGDTTKIRLIPRTE